MAPSDFEYLARFGREGKKTGKLAVLIMAFPWENWENPHLTLLGGVGSRKGTSSRGPIPPPSKFSLHG